MSSPYPSLQTQSLPSPQIWEMEPPAALKSALESRFCPLQTTHPGLLRFGKTKKQSPFLRFDQRWHLDGFIGEVPHRSGHFSGKVREYKTTGLSGTPVAGATMDISGFCKITHLLDAYRMLQGNYPVSQHPALPSPGKKSAKVYGKLHDPHNQAYVDAVACYMLSKFREADHSPHFSLFYGAYLAIAKEYFYNITEDFSDLRFEKWFWRRKNQGHFKLLGFNGDEPMDADSPLLVSPDEDLDLDESSTEGSDSSSEGSHISELGGYESAAGRGGETGSIHSASITTASDSDETYDSEDDDDDSDYDSEGMDDNTKLFAAMSEFPTMLIFLESNTNTMDSLLDETDVSVEAEADKWRAWLFQVIAALCQIQSLWAMTHNDLHSNNILWTATDKPYLYYSTADGRMWRVPTYGKIFRIIDFGRAIYTHNDVLCVSDDYWPENEAGTQYNFGPFYDPEEPLCYPNPSFDLCRLSVSIIEALFQEVPEDREGGGVLSDETNFRQNETVSDLYNILWEWLIDEDGRNVLWNPDKSERYPGFDLYSVIAKKVKGAVPRDQLNKKAFAEFCLKEKVPEGEKVYSLFC
jgi:hypothetical protein